MRRFVKVYFLKVKKVVYSCQWNSMSELRDVTCHMGSRSVTCHPTQVNTPRLNPSQTGWYSIDLPRRDGRLSWPMWPVKTIYRLQTVTHPSTNPAEHGRESNSQPVDYESDALTTTPPSRQYIFSVYVAMHAERVLFLNRTSVFWRLLFWVTYIFVVVLL